MAENQKFNLRRLHYFSGMILALFIGIHLFNHLYAILGPDAHITLMGTLRHVYRNIICETLLLGACVVQIVSGIALVRRRKGMQKGWLERLQVWSGLYLAIFLMIHLGAVLAGRFILHLDTNFYFGAAGLNTFPFMLFFIPYYALAILAVTGHVAAIHGRKMQRALLGLSPQQQSAAILVLGFCGMLGVLYAMTGHFQGVEIPQEYGVLVGK